MQEPGSQFFDERKPNLDTTVEVEIVRDSGEHIPNELSDTIPAHLGGVAVAKAESPGVPEITDVQQLESERKKNTVENLRTLQKRFGERFVKGNLMEGGGYTGGAARELLAGFMDRPGFADELKRLIPNRHGALALLKNNHAYIQATLEQLYKDDPTHERAPAKDPYELARSVGYELTGPFESTGEFVPYDQQDFRPNERLCTFNEPTSRLRNYHILWLRHAEVNETLPADMLTLDTLSNTWKIYLKTIGRYDQDSDSYDLTDLRPARDDPYGTSSMSVQISRQGTHVSIKNRYNHTVSNPDNTLDSDLDHVAYGLKRAVYTWVGREDLMDKTSVALAEGYIADNDGGIHAYQYEEDNVYYGDYEYIENGVVTTIDRGKYYMISPQLYVPKSGKGDELRLGQRNGGDAESALNDVLFLYESSKIDGNEKDPRIGMLRREYAERDWVELKVLTIERIRDQLRSTYSAYNMVAEHLGGNKQGLFARRETGATQAEFERMFAEKDKEWRENGTYDEVVERFVKDDIRFNLLATPEIDVTEDQIIALAENFGKDQPHRTYVWNTMYRKKRYADRLWSGFTGKSKVKFSLIEANLDPRLADRTADDQRQILADIQAKQPSLNARAPSLLDAITNWYTLCARGDKLSDSTAFDKTFVRHFDLKDQRLGDWLCVPYSCVGVGGEPNLSYSDARDHDDGRLAVG